MLSSPRVWMEAVVPPYSLARFVSTFVLQSMMIVVMMVGVATL